MSPVMIFLVGLFTSFLIALFVIITFFEMRRIEAASARESRLGPKPKV